MRIFLDDERLPLEDGQPWRIVRTIEDFFKAIEESEAADDPITLISFDHDLGEEQEAKHAVRRLIDMELDSPGRFAALEKVVFHTANIIELDKMASEFECAGRNGILPHLVIQKRSALYTRYEIAPEFH